MTFHTNTKLPSAGSCSWDILFSVSSCGIVKDYRNKRLLATATTVLKTNTVTSEEQCVLSCYYETTGCLAVNVITTGDVITCEMTTGLSNDSDIENDLSSTVYVTSMFVFKKTESQTNRQTDSHIRFKNSVLNNVLNTSCICSQSITYVWKCLASVTMEHVNQHGRPPDVTVLLVTMVRNEVSNLTWTSARCRCDSGYYGNRCGKHQHRVLQCGIKPRSTLMQPLNLPCLEVAVCSLDRFWNKTIGTSLM